MCRMEALAFVIKLCLPCCFDAGKEVDGANAECASDNEVASASTSSFEARPRRRNYSTSSFEAAAMDGSDGEETTPQSDPGGGGGAGSGRRLNRATRHWQGR